jgi:hypothetical protein
MGKTGAVTLSAGAPTPIVLTATGLKTTLALSWQNPPGLGWQLVPAQALYSANLIARLGDTYVRFLKSASLASALALTADEIAWLGADPTRMVDTTCTRPSPPELSSSRRRPWPTSPSARPW